MTEWLVPCSLRLTGPSSTLSYSHDVRVPAVRKPDWKLLRTHLYNEGTVSKADCLELLDLATSLFSTSHPEKEKTLMEVRDPITIVGDIHGQYYDLVKMLEVAGDPEEMKYLFLGDYVDRGCFSMEVIMLLFSIKICHPATVLMIRGNHECRQMTSYFNFREECLFKYDLETYERVMDCFDCMPLGCLVNGKFLAVHGGIGPSFRLLDDLGTIKRFKEPPNEGVYCDVLWADPVDSETGESDSSFPANENRGCSVYYGAASANSFLKRNGLISVIRAHEAQLEGYKMYKWNGPQEFPLVITLFSAPNYCDVYNNKAAVIALERGALNIKQFNYSAHPYMLPEFMDVFAWSLPFVVEKVLEVMANVLQRREEEVQVEGEGTRVRELQIAVRESKIEVVRKKVRAITSMRKMFKTLREEKELILQLKGLCPDKKIPTGLLMEGRGALQSALSDFRRAKKWDSANDRRPGV